MTKTEQLLTWMKAQPAGCTLREIQTFLLKLDPETRKHIDPKTGYRYRHKRGWWGTNLYEDSRYSNRRGILNKFCQKVNDRWVVTEPIKAPFYTNVETKSYRMNRVRKKQEYRDYVKKLPKCPECGRVYRKGEGRAPENLCIMTSSSSGYVIDCMGSVYYTVEYRHTDLSENTLTNLTREQLDNWMAVIGRDESITYEEGIAKRQAFVKSRIIVRN